MTFIWMHRCTQEVLPASKQHHREADFKEMDMDTHCLGWTANGGCLQWIMNMTPEVPEPSKPVLKMQVVFLTVEEIIVILSIELIKDS